MSIAPILCLLLVLSCEARRRRPTSMKEPKTYCGPRLTKQLHDFCAIFYGPSDIKPEDLRSRELVVDKCCDAPCSILYIVVSYCKEPKDDEIRRTFGEDELKYYEELKRNMTRSSNSTITTILPVMPETTEKNVRRKKHIRKRRKKRKCKCNDPQEIEKKNRLMRRTVPEYIIGLADYPENEPIIIDDLF